MNLGQREERFGDLISHILQEVTNEMEVPKTVKCEIDRQIAGRKNETVRENGKISLIEEEGPPRKYKKVLAKHKKV